MRPASLSCGGAPQRGGRAAEPRLARVRRLAARRGRQHRDQRRLGHLAAGRGHPGVADERALADLDPLDPQPAAAELVAADQGVVGEERLVVDLGERRDHQHGRGLDVLADPRAEQPQPGRGEAGRRRAGTARSARRRAPARSSTPPAPAPLRTGCTPGRTARPAMRTTAQTSTARDRPCPTSTETGSQTQQAKQVGVRRGVVGQRAQGTAAPASTATIGRHESSTATAPYAAVQAGGLGPVRPRAPGLASGSAPPASPTSTRRRGPPRTPTSRAPPRRPCRRLRPGTACSARRSGPARPTRTGPRCDDVAVDPEAAEVDLGLDRAAGAEPEHAGDRRDAVQVDVRADLGAQQPGVPRHVRRPGQPGRADLVDHALRPATAAGAPGRRAGGHPARPCASRSRAPAAASSIRPGGVTKTSQPTASSHQGRRGQQGPAEPVGEQPASRCRPRPASAARRAHAAARVATHLAGLGLQWRRRDGAGPRPDRRRPSASR